MGKHSAKGGKSNQGLVDEGRGKTAKLNYRDSKRQTGKISGSVSMVANSQKDGGTVRKARDPRLA